MKFNSFIANFFTLIMIAALYGCANIPTHIIVAPEIATTQGVTHHNKQAQLNVIDMRTAKHIVQIMRKDEASTLVSAQENIENTIKKTLSKHWQQQGLTINDHSVNQVNISIEKAIISVNQTTFEYEVQTEILLKVVVKNGTQTLTIDFKNRGNSEGPLKADIAVLERNFNQRLTKLLQQILANKKINDFFI
jgi:uncharacterized lipoprotein